MLSAVRSEEHLLRERDRLLGLCSRNHGPNPVYERSYETAREALLPNVGSGVLPLASVE